MFQSDKKINS